MQIVAWLIKANVRLQGSTRITVKKSFLLIVFPRLELNGWTLSNPRANNQTSGFLVFSFLLSAKVITRSTGQNANARVIKRPASSVGRAWDS